MRIGLITDCLRRSLPAALALARELGAEGVQLYAVEGAVCPEALDAAGRRSLRGDLDRAGLVLSALCGDLGGHAFTRAAENPGRIARSCAIVDLAVDLGCQVVTTHVGVIPADPGHPRRVVLTAACRAIGTYASRGGVRFAIETGPEPAAVLADFLDDCACPGLGVNLDPANLAMVQGEDAAAAVAILAPWIVHTHAKDGVRHQPCDAEAVYDAFASGGFAELERRTGALFSETPLGQGQVDWPRYLAALRTAGYDGWLTIERETGDDPTGDIGAAVGFLRAALPPDVGSRKSEVGTSSR
jgi:sugar phosphate isomerase/epimerase